MKIITIQSITNVITRAHNIRTCTSLSVFVKPLLAAKKTVSSFTYLALFFLITCTADKIIDKTKTIGGKELESNSLLEANKTSEIFYSFIFRIQIDSGT